MGIMSRNGRFFSFLVMSCIVLLLGFSCWAVKHNRRTADSSFQLENMVLCDEVDEKMRPLHTGTQFMSGIRQLCLCFDYSLASKRSDIRIKWYYGDHLVYSEVLLLSPGKGSKVDGSCGKMVRHCPLEPMMCGSVTREQCIPA